MGVPERRQKGKIERREGILAAAERVFIRKGIASSTMEDIAREAELSKGALYLYFQSKDELFLSIANRATCELEERYGAALSKHEGEPGFVALEAGMYEYVRYAREQRERFRAVMSWMSVEYPVDGTSELFAEYRDAIGRVFALAIGAIRRGQQDGSVRSDVLPDRLGLQLWGAAMGVLSLDESTEQIRRRVQQASEVDELAVEFVAVLMAGVRTDSAPRSQRTVKQVDG